jgi:nitroreductase/NAD-dependent dihydropyrimidine dehydrogenase PreA subunit
MTLENAKIILDQEKCTQCGSCVKVCPYELYELESKILMLQDEETFEEECIECGHCAAACPTSAIALKAHLNEELRRTPKREELPSYDKLYQLSSSRRSVRNFTQERVPRELIKKTLDLARYTPTGHNEENVHYLVVQEPQVLQDFSDEITRNVRNLVEKFEDDEGRASLKAVMPEKVFQKAEEAMPGFKRNLARVERGVDPWRRGSQIILMHAPKTAATLVENCSLAACHVMLAAGTLGLTTCSLGYATAMTNQFRSVGKIVGIPRKHEVGYTLAIGYPDVKYPKIPARKSVNVKWT